jgi:hypothetical protein
LTLLRKGWIAVFLLLVPFAAGAMDIDWCVFRAQQFTAIQQFGQSFSGEVSWNPLFDLGKGFGVRGNVGGTILKGFPDQFVAAEYEARLSYAVTRTLAVEAGGGAQTWFQKTGGTSPLVSAAVSWMFFRKFSWLRAGVTAGYSLFLPKDNATHEARLGVALAFGSERK